MSLMEGRGGFPKVYRFATDTVGRDVTFPFTTKHLILRNPDVTNTIKVYFTQTDFTADINSILLPISAALSPYGEWQGPVECGAIWVKASAGTPTIEVVAFQRRG